VVVLVEVPSSILQEPEPEPTPESPPRDPDVPDVDLLVPGTTKMRLSLVPGTAVSVLNLGCPYWLVSARVIFMPLKRLNYPPVGPPEVPLRLLGAVVAIWWA